MNDGLKEKHRHELIDILSQYQRVEKAVLFGSRSMGTFTTASDVDIALFGDDLTLTDLARLTEKFENTSIPQTVDLLLFRTVESEKLLAHIKEHGVLLWGKGDKIECRVVDSEWTERRLGDVIITNVATYSKKDEWKFINYLDTGNITENQISEIQHIVVGEDKIPSRAKRKILPGDIVYSTVRPIQRHYGILRKPAENLLVSTGFVTICAKKKEADTNFIYWFLVHPEIIERLQIIGEHSTSAYPSIKPSDIENLKLNLPPLPEQKAIAHILGSLDDKIELNRRMNETLEAMAQALFKSWFVDFDPVIDKALIAGNPLPEELQQKGEVRRVNLEEKYGSIEAAAESSHFKFYHSHFPSEFIQTDEMGWIPKGWRVGRFGDVAKQKRLPAHPSSIPADTPYIGLEHMPMGSISLGNWGKAEDISSGKSWFSENDILFGKLRPYFHKVGVAPVGGVCSTDIVVLTPKKDEWFSTALCIVSNKVFIEYTTAGSTGTKMPRTNWKDMAAYKICLPTRNMANMFDALLRPSITKILANLHVDRYLSQTRNTLLPKLLSGEIRIAEAEKLLEEANKL